MPRLTKLAALLLVALWLPATLHCRLEGLGLDGLFACADEAGRTAHDDGADCADEGCQSIESGQITLTKSRADLNQLPALLETGSFCLFLLAPPAPAPEICPARQDEALPLRRTWQFVRRAALPARAPSLLG